MDSERTYKAIFDAANDAIAIYDAETGAILDANHRMCEMYGYPRDEVKNLDIGVRSGGFEPYSQEDALRWIKKAATEGPQLFEWQAKDSLGRLFWVEVNLRRSAIDGQDFVLSVVRDISKRKLVEEELHATKDYLRTVFNSVYDAIIVHDPDGRVVDVNDKMLDMYGVSREEALKLSIIDDYSARDNPIVEVWERWKKVLVGENQFFEWKAKRPKDGSIFYVEVFLTKLALPQGNAILANVRDVTDKKKAEDELKAKSLSLEEVNAALRVLLRQREQDKEEMEGRIVDNVRKLVLPYVERLKESRLEDEQKVCLNILETNLMNIVSSFVQKMASAYSHFTRSEILVANLIRDGKTVKEIARVSGVSENAVNRHRQNIRNKLGLNRQKVSLKTYLMSFH
jgi:two-component system, sporulation sensor kinase E